LRRAIAIFVLQFTIHHSLFTCLGQEIPPATEEQLENQATFDESETEDDSYLQQLEHYKKHPLNLNEAMAEDLREFIFLTPFQVDNFISYRQLLGKLVSIYELQSIPGWDLNTIRKMIPFVVVGAAESVSKDLTRRVKNGEHMFLLRISRILEKSAGFKSSITAAKYSGSRERIFFRYRHQYKNLLQYGIAADKDAGEQFFKGARRSGFDFYSFHVFARHIGKIKAIALGDFTVNMGQGLVQWQSLALKKGPEVMGIKRQSSILLPYSSSGEFYFQRGVGITLHHRKKEATVFMSMRKLSGNLFIDSLTQEDKISSLLSSGYHRTATEIAHRKNLRQSSVGANINFRSGSFCLAVNAISFGFSLPIDGKSEPYKKYAVSGKSWSNFSIDYSKGFRNLHFFGEAAIDKNLHMAFLNGLLISVDSRVDVSFLQRTISKEYQAVNGNAFTENGSPTNETGWYAGISLRPVPGWKFDLYSDLSKFLWLKYLVDAPSTARDFFVQLSYAPNKQVEIVSRFRGEMKESNFSDNISESRYLIPVIKQNWRTQINYTLSESISLRNRIELLWFNKDSPGSETGFLNFFELFYKPRMKHRAFNFRLQYFETGGFSSRIFAYENDVLYSNSIPSFYDKGWRVYLNFKTGVAKSLTIWARLARTMYNGKQSIGSGLDEILGSKKTELKLQLVWNFENRKEQQ
jgi:hypothetical protein